MLFNIASGTAVPEMTPYNIFLLLLWILFTLALLWTAPAEDVSVVEQLKRRINKVENEKRKLKWQLASYRARASSTEARTAVMFQDTSAEQRCVDSDQPQCNEEEDASRALEVRPRSDEVQLLTLCRSTVLEYIAAATGFAERRNAAVSRLYFELFGETNGNVQLLSSLTDPWRQWTELLVTERNSADQVFTQWLERASRSEGHIEELALPTGHQHPPGLEQDWGFDRVLDLVRLRLSLPLSHPETIADHAFLHGAGQMIRSRTPRGGHWDGAGDSSSPRNRVHKPGCPHRARALCKRLPGVPEQGGSLE